MLANFTKEEIAIIALVAFVALSLFYSFLKSLEKKTTKVKKKVAVTVPPTLESLEKRIIALEKNKPKGK